MDAEKLVEAIREAIVADLTRQAEADGTYCQPHSSGSCTIDGAPDIAQLARAALAAIEAEGWTCVPREATEAMLDAGADATQSDGLVWSSESGEGLDGVDAEPIWTAMLAAAPKP